jgi:hypothetical protein
MRYTVAKREEMLGIAPLIVAGLISGGASIIASYFGSKGKSNEANATLEAARLKAAADAKDAEIKKIAVIGGLGVASIAVIGFMFS